jgi:predicted nucleotide-binding protein
LSKSVLESLLDVLDSVDFGIFIFGRDDALARGTSVTRDNVIYELGLFTGRLGRNRVFIVHPKDSGAYHFPTDLLGVTIATFDQNRMDQNWEAALGPACGQIRKLVIGGGTRHDRPLVST